MGNGAFKFKDNSGNVVSYISGSGTDIIISGGTLDLSGMCSLNLGGISALGTIQTASFAPNYLLTSSFNTYTGSINNIIGTLQTNTGSLNNYTSSNNTRLNVIESTTGSLNSYTSSNDTIIGSLQTSTSSLNNYTSSNNIRLSCIEIKTGSYATTGSNTVCGNLTVTGYIDAQELRTTYISSSILYRSGSTKFGDELSDNHSFTGSMLISGSISVPGSNLVSGSAQIDVLSTTNIARLATTGSNIFSGSQIVTGSVCVNGSLSLTTPLSVANGGTGQTTLAAAGINTGSGTLNYLPKYTATGTTFGNSNASDDGTTFNVNLQGKFTGLSGSRILTLNAPTNGGSLTFEASGTAFADMGSYPSIIGGGSATDFVFNTRGYSSLTLSTAFAPRITILSNGNVGIGTASPGTLLDVKGVGTNLTGNIYYNFFARNAAGSQGIYLGYNETATVGVIGGGGQSTNGIAFTTGPSFLERMRIDGSGNVGIGTNNPQYRLDVHNPQGTIHLKSTTGTNDVYFRTANTGGDGFFGLESSTGGNVVINSTPYSLVVSHNSARSFHLGTNNTVRLTVNSTGNVGIGTESPTNLLHLYGTDGNSYLRWTSDLATTGTRIGYNGTEFRIDQQQNADVTIRTNSTEKMRITSGGAVLVGRTSGGLTNESGSTITNSSIAVEGTSYVFYGNRTTTDGLFMGIRRNNVDVGSITVTTSATAFNTSSDYRLKQDFKDYNGLNLISAIKTYNYEWKSDNTRTYGVLAHELQEVIPQAVFGEKDGKEMQGVDYSKLVPILIKSVQEQQCRINLLETCLGLI